MRKLVLLAALGCALSACSVSFDPAGQPCDLRGKCLAGYRCDATKHCVAGGTGSGSGSTSGTGTAGTSGTTGSGACGGVVCPFEAHCVVRDGGAAACVPASFACVDDAQCGAGQCLRSANGQGLCSQDCAADGGCPSGSGCQAVVGARGNVFSRCLPLTPPHNCSSGRDCAGTGYGCLPFDDPQAVAPDPELPVGWCDLPPDGGADGSACTAGGGCASGLCAASGTPSRGLCVELCAQDADCRFGQSCAEVQALPSGRLVRACVGSATACLPCGGCGPDAPDCDPATQRCVLSCRPADTAPCGAAQSRSCVASPLGGASFCSADGGSC